LAEKRLQQAPHRAALWLRGQLRQRVIEKLERGHDTTSCRIFSVNAVLK
jgi:hypothetical protein